MNSPSIKNQTDFALAPVLVILVVILIFGIWFKQHASYLPESEKQIAALSSTELAMIDNIDLIENYDLIKNFSVESSKIDIKTEENLPEHQNENLQQRYKKWRSLDPNKKAQLKENFQRFNSLSMPEQVKIRRNWHRFEQLTLKEQAVLKEKCKRWQETRK